MAEKPLEFPFRTLLIEDSQDWSSDMIQAWGKAGLDLAANADEARRLLESNRYHFITIDQNLPETAGGRALPDVGVDICRLVVTEHPCSPRILFTAFGDIAIANRIGRMDETEYWEKSGTGKDDPARCKYSARGWAKAVRDYLEVQLDEHYLPFVLRQGGRFFPGSLADQARNLERRLERRDKDGAFLGFAIDLWQSTLHLSFAHAQALAQRHRGRVASPPPSNKLEDMERGLSTLWPELAGAGWLGPWGAYVGKGKVETGDGAGTRFLVKGSQPLRLQRNREAHEFTRKVWTDHWKALRIPLLHLLDAATLWADHPLLTRLKPVPGYADRWQGEAIFGAGPWRVREVVARGPRPHPEAVYTRWLDPNGTPVLIPLAPFVVLEPDAQINRLILWVLSHRDSGGTWWRRSLHDGQVQRWPEGDSLGAQALDTHFLGEESTQG